MCPEGIGGAGGWDGGSPGAGGGVGSEAVITPDVKIFKKNLLSFVVELLWWW